MIVDLFFTQPISAKRLNSFNKCLWNTDYVSDTLLSAEFKVMNKGDVGVAHKSPTGSYSSVREMLC